MIEDKRLIIKNQGLGWIRWIKNQGCIILSKRSNAWKISSPKIDR